MRKKLLCTLGVIWNLLYPLLVYEAITNLLIIGIQTLWGRIPDEGVLVVTALAALLTAFPLGTVYLLQVRPFARYRWSCQYEDEQRPSLGWVIPAGIGACCFLNIVIALLNITTPAYEETRKLLYHPPIPVQILCMAVIVPLTEELVFRGIGFFSIRRWLGFYPAALATAVFFALFHGNLSQGVYAFVLGLMLAFCCERYGSLRAACLLHGTANLASVVISGLPDALWQQIGTAMFFLMLFGGLGLMIIGFYMMREDRRTT